MKKNITALFSKFWSRFLALTLVAVIGLTGCGADPGGLTGNYVSDAEAVIKSLRYAIELPDKDAGRVAAQADARGKINAFASRYRRDADKLKLSSFTTLRTALNGLASYYNTTSKRSVPVKVRDRVLVELDRAETALSQGR